VHDADPEDRPLLVLLHPVHHPDVLVLGALLSLQPAAGVGSRCRLVHAALPPRRDHPGARHGAGALVDREQLRLAHRSQHTALHHPGQGAPPEARRLGITPPDPAQCRDVIRRGGLLVALLAAAALAIPAASASAAVGAPTLDLNGPKSPGLLDKVNAVGTLPGALPGDKVTVTVEASGRTVAKQQVDASSGKFSFPFTVDSCCNYEVTASSGGQSSAPQRFNVRVPKHLRKGPVTRLYNQSLVDEGYYIGPNVGSRFTRGTALATAACRTINGMARNATYK